MALFFLGFAVHIYRVFSRPYSPSAPDLEAQNFASRACHTACHDIPVFFYFFVAPAAFIWACIGFSVQSKARDREDLPGSQCPSSVITGTWVVALVMLLYLIGTVFVGLVSCCLEGQRSTNNPDAGQGQPSRLMAHLMRPDFGNTHTGTVRVRVLGVEACHLASIAGILARKYASCGVSRWQPAAVPSGSLSAAFVK